MTKKAFAAMYKMGLESVQTLVSLADEAYDCNVAECNGDPHPESKDKTDKNLNAKLWGRDGDRLTKRIKNLTEHFGFTDVIYTGLRPTLKRGEEWVEIPS